MSKVKTIEVDHKEVKSISEDQLKGLQETVNKQNKIQMQIGGIEGHKAGLISFGFSHSAKRMNCGPCSVKESTKK